VRPILASAVAWLLAAAALPAPGAAAPSPPPAETRNSPRYVLEVHGNVPDAAELLKVAEALFPQLAKHYGTAPKERMQVALYEKAADYSDALTKAGLVGEGFSPSGRYLPLDGKVHMPLQDRATETRRWWIVHLADQFAQQEVFAKNKPVPTWYRVGLLAQFATHRWDGKTLATGVEDEVGGWGRALEERAKAAREGRWEPFDAVTEDTKTYVEGWPVVRYMLAGPDKGLTARFRALERRMWEGMEAKDSVALLLGADPKKAKEIRAAAKAWLLARTRAWEPVRDLWERTGEDAFTAENFRPEVEPLLVSGAGPGDPPWIEATVIPGEASGGLVLGRAEGEADDALVCTWTQGRKIELLRRAGGPAGSVLGSADGPAGPEARLRLECSGGVARVLLAGKEVLAVPVEGIAATQGRAGLVANGGRVRFTGVKVAPPKAPAKK
jgi:hypothetical protein